MVENGKKLNHMLQMLSFPGAPSEFNLASSSCFHIRKIPPNPYPPGNGSDYHIPNQTGSSEKHRLPQKCRRLLAEYVIVPGRVYQ